MFIHFGQRDICHHSIFGEGAGTHEVEELLAFTAEPGGVIGHQTLTLGHPKRIASQLSIYKPNYS